MSGTSRPRSQEPWPVIGARGSHHSHSHSRVEVEVEVEVDTLHGSTRAIVGPSHCLACSRTLLLAAGCWRASSFFSSNLVSAKIKRKCKFSPLKSYPKDHTVYRVKICKTCFDLNVLTQRKASLKTLESFECLRSWLRPPLKRGSCTEALISGGLN